MQGVVTINLGEVEGNHKLHSESNRIATGNQKELNGKAKTQSLNRKAKNHCGHPSTQHNSLCSPVSWQLIF